MRCCLDSTPFLGKLSFFVFVSFLMYLRHPLLICVGSFATVTFSVLPRALFYYFIFASCSSATCSLGQRLCAVLHMHRQCRKGKISLSSNMGPLKKSLQTVSEEQFHWKSEIKSDCLPCDTKTTASTRWSNISIAVRRTHKTSDFMLKCDHS